jgi:hypothetical protein
MIAEVKTLYESNYRDVPTCLGTLRTDVVRDDVKQLAVVCIRNGVVDVRGMGHLDVYQTYTLLAQGMRYLEPILLTAMTEPTK